MDNAILIRMENSKKIKIFAALIATILTWSSAFVAIRVGVKGYHPGSLALLRYLIASLCMFMLFVKMKERAKISGKEALSLVAVGFFGFAIYNVALNYGEVSVPAGITSFIISLIPVFVIILAIFFLKEKLRPIQYLGVAISLIGVIIIAVGERDDAHFDYGVLYNLIAALSGALYVILQKPLLRKFSPIEVTTYGIWSGTLLMLIFVPQMMQDIAHASLVETGAVVYLGIFPAALGYLCWSYVLSHFPASRASTFLYALPLVSTGMGFLFLSEIPSFLSLFGGLFALMGAIIVNKRKATVPA